MTTGELDATVTALAESHADIVGTAERSGRGRPVLWREGDDYLRRRAFVIAQGVDPTKRSALREAMGQLDRDGRWRAMPARTFQRREAELRHRP